MQPCDGLAPFPASARARLEDIYAKPNRALFDETGPLDW